MHHLQTLTLLRHSAVLYFLSVWHVGTSISGKRARFVFRNESIAQEVGGTLF
jgi:hypothetical protein